MPRLPSTVYRLPFFAALAAGLIGCAQTPVVPPGSTILAPPPPQITPGEPVAPGTMEYVSPFGPAAPPTPPANPLRVPVGDLDVAWEQIVAVIQEYFKIEHEDRVRLIGDVLTEGRIDTFPESGATLLEPWRKDSVTYRDQLECTLQSIRRVAHVRVMPDQGCFIVELTVFKELENLSRPARSTAGSAAFQKDATLDRSSEPLPSLSQPPGVGRLTPVPAPWIRLGRDANLEAAILAKIQARMSEIAAPAFTTPGGTYGLPPAQ